MGREVTDAIPNIDFHSTAKFFGCASVILSLRDSHGRAACHQTYAGIATPIWSELQAQRICHR